MATRRGSHYARMRCTHCALSITRFQMVADHSMIPCSTHDHVHSRCGWLLNWRTRTRGYMLHDMAWAARVELSTYRDSWHWTRDVP
jgi:hypothetical protein